MSLKKSKTNPNDFIGFKQEVTYDIADVPGGLICSSGPLTKREYLAAKAMQGIVSNKAAIDQLKVSSSHQSIAASVADEAVFMADALIAELNKETK